MIKLLILMAVIFLSLQTVSQTKKQLHLSVQFERCSLLLIFKNKGQDRILIPNFTIRRKIEDGYIVLSDRYIKVDNDTIIVSINQNADFLKDSLQITHSPKKENYFINYRDIFLKKKNKQIVRLPMKFCNSNFKFCKIVYDGILLTSNKIIKSNM
jgi:hypothetical protein